VSKAKKVKKVNKVKTAETRAKSHLATTASREVRVDLGGIHSQILRTRGRKAKQARSRRTYTWFCWLAESSRTPWKSAERSSPCLKLAPHDPEGIHLSGKRAFRSCDEEQQIAGKTW